ncbi:MAG: nucleotidyltransferase domain-containing protein [Gaiellaceae bacterium]
MFTVEDRERARQRMLALADEDARVVESRLVGSLATGGDCYSDLDLTFAVADELGGVQLFDLPAGPNIYRVFLLPGCLQMDISFTPATQFDCPRPGPPEERELFGYAVHHALRARFSIERGRLWLAEYWVSAVRDYALSLACARRGLASGYGRGFDDLPEEVLAQFEGALARSLDRAELLRALRVAVAGLLQEGGDQADLRMLVEADTLS